MKPVFITKISKIIPIYKNDIPAEKIEVARIMLEYSECQFNIVVQKGKYKPGDKVIYIMPDYCLPDTELFKEYTEPGGDKSKSKLGKKGRIRAVKFNFSFKDEYEPIYSNGILIPFVDLPEELKEKINNEPALDLQKELQIVKYESEIYNSNDLSNGLIKGPIPSFLYVTDEERIELIFDKFSKAYDEKEVIYMTKKFDGSSITIYCKKNNENSNIYDFGVCSRRLEKKLDQTLIIGYKTKDETLINKKTIYLKGKKVNIFINTKTGEKYTFDELSQFTEIIPIYKKLEDAWVSTVIKNRYLDKLYDYCSKYNLELALRGELIGEKSKGSGNKNNPDSKGELRVVWFGVDDLSSGYAKRLNESHEHNLKRICNELSLNYADEISSGIWNYNDAINEAKKYFKKCKEVDGKIIEGVVFRTKFSNKLSCKFINPEYDMSF